MSDPGDIHQSLQFIEDLLEKYRMEYLQISLEECGKGFRAILQEAGTLCDDGTIVVGDQCPSLGEAIADLAQKTSLINLEHRLA